MISLLIRKELHNILTGPKFVSTFATCSILILLSIYIGIKEFEYSQKQYETGVQLAEQDLREKTSWMGTSTRTFRQPDPMQIFAAGVNKDIGRFSNISDWNFVKLQNSFYSDDPIFAVFRSIDFVFIVQIVLSLVAIIFTYNAINGERETGTLKLIFSNSVPKAKYLTGKFIGFWLGLIVPMSIPFLLGILLILLFNVQMSFLHWEKLITLLIISVLYISFFIFLGLLISTWTSFSSNSFLILLVFWITFVLIIPRCSVLISGQIIDVPTIAELEGQTQGYENEQWRKHENDLSEVWKKRNAEMAGMTSAEREEYEDKNLWNWMEEDDAARKNILSSVSNFRRKQIENFRNKKFQMEKLAFSLSRFSPASSYQLAAINIAGTDIGLKNIYENAMEEYKTTFTNFIEKKQKEDEGVSGIQITMDSERGFSFKTPDLKKTIDLSELPRFTAPEKSYSQIAQATIIDIGLLTIYIILTFTIAFFKFVKYDVR